MRLPTFETIGHGRRKWRVGIEVLPLASFQSEVAATFGQTRGRLPVAFWRDTDRKVILRADRRPEQRMRDLRHELAHVFVDWCEAAYPDPGD